MPLWNWWKVQETLNYKYLSKVGGGKQDYSYDSMKIYEEMFNEYIVVGGLGKEYEQLLEMKKEWLELRCEYLETDNKMVKMESNLLHIDISDKERYLNSLEGMTKEDTVVIISEYLGSHIDTKIITVKEYYNYLNYYKKKR